MTSDPAKFRGARYPGKTMVCYGDSLALPTHPAYLTTNVSYVYVLWRLSSKCWFYSTKQNKTKGDSTGNIKFANIRGNILGCNVFCFFRCLPTKLVRVQPPLHLGLAGSRQLQSLTQGPQGSYSMWMIKLTKARYYLSSNIYPLPANHQTVCFFWHGST